MFASVSGVQRQREVRQTMTQITWKPQQCIMAPP